MSVIGIADFRAAMSGLPDKLKKNVLRDALTKAAAPVLAAAQAATPVMSAALALKAPYRRPGTVKNALAIRDSRAAKLEGNVGVFVNVRPLPGNKYKGVRVANLKKPGKKRTQYVLISKSQRSSKNPDDPYYWFFIWKGTRKMAGRDYLGSGVTQLGKSLEIFEKEIGDTLERLNNNPGALP